MDFIRPNADHKTGQVFISWSATTGLRFYPNIILLMQVLNAIDQTVLLHSPKMKKSTSLLETPYSEDFIRSMMIKMTE